MCYYYLALHTHHYALLCSFGSGGQSKAIRYGRGSRCAEAKQYWRYFYYGSRFYEAASRGRCALRSPDPPLEPQDGKYIFTERNGIYIIDLQKTVKKLDEAYNFVREVAAEGGDILFVGTKKQAQESIRDEALRCGMHYVNARWLGGMMTNFRTIRKRIDRMDQLKTMQEDGTFELLPKKEVASSSWRWLSWTSTWAASRT